MLRVTLKVRIHEYTVPVSIYNNNNFPIVLNIKKIVCIILLGFKQKQH